MAEQWSLCAAVCFIISRLEQRGFEAYAVGGCVRDLMLGKKPKDWDISTSAKPEQTKACFSDFTVWDTGIQHGTVAVRIEGQSYEITTFRVDGPYLDHRRPQSVAFVQQIQEDLARRDFTINAMAFHPERGLLDFFSGKQDLEQGILRCVGNPVSRFKEDGLRMMRAIRFASVYDFSIEEDTGKALLNGREILRAVAAERIRTELCKLLLGKAVGRVLRDYGQVLCVVIPEIQPLMGFQQKNPHHCFDVWEHTVEAVAASERTEILRLTMLFHDMGKPACHFVGMDGMDHFHGHSGVSAMLAKKILSRLKFDRVTEDCVVELVRYHDAEIAPEKKVVKRWLHDMGEEQFRRLLGVKHGDLEGQSSYRRQEKLDFLQSISRCMEFILRENLCFSLKELHINGTDLMELGIHQGKEIGEWLGWALEEVMEERLPNDKVILLEAVGEKRLMKQENRQSQMNTPILDSDNIKNEIKGNSVFK